MGTARPASYEVTFQGRTYVLTEQQATQIRAAYQDVLNAGDGLLATGTHQVLMATLQRAGVPVRSFLEAEEVAAQL